MNLLPMTPILLYLLNASMMPTLNQSVYRAYKLLGIHLDEHLNFNFHTNFLCNKLSRSLFCIRRAKNILTPTALKTLYFAFIQSHLNYCPIILSSINQQNFNQIKLIQKKAIRIITNSSYTAHTAPLFAQLQILPYELIVKQSCLRFYTAKSTH